MAAVGRLEADPLFLGLTRPAMILGVTYSWFTMNAMGWITYFVNTSDFFYLIVGSVAVHIIGVLILSKDPHFMDILIKRGQKCLKCKNKLFHGNTQSFDVY